MMEIAFGVTISKVCSEIVHRQDEEKTLDKKEQMPYWRSLLARVG